MIFLIDLQYYKIFTVTLYENYIQFIYKYDLWYIIIYIVLFDPCTPHHLTEKSFQLLSSFLKIGCNCDFEHNDKIFGVAISLQL